MEPAAEAENQTEVWQEASLIFVKEKVVKKA